MTTSAFAEASWAARDCTGLRKRMYNLMMFVGVSMSGPVSCIGNLFSSGLARFSSRARRYCFIISASGNVFTAMILETPAPIPDWTENARNGDAGADRIGQLAVLEDYFLDRVEIARHDFYRNHRVL